ncbi:MAG: hypothetical protein PF488_01285 [Patescibacteria group bacterium]|jgi:hypothetical protein|nr:hypothetical protein [Patescibacteria group bacterium]
MTGKQLITNLRELKNEQPDNDFLKENRELLLTQISNSGGEKIGSFKRFLIAFENLAKASAKPAMSIALFLLVLVTAGVFGASYLESSKPNDSLYIARVLSERMKVNTTFNEEAREKLASKYALSHAEDIVLILSDENFHSEENSEQIARLSQDFKEEISKASEGINNLERNNNQENITSSTSNNNEDRVEISENSSEGNEDGQDVKDEGVMIIAENNKDENGIEIMTTSNEEEEMTEEEVIEMEIAQVEDQLKGTSSEDIIKEITDLFEKDKFDEAKLKLNVLKEILQ